MSQVDDLIKAYGDFIALPWQADLAHPQRVLMAIYAPKYERRVRLRLKDFENATNKADRGWKQVDISNLFEEWLSDNAYKERYFARPKRLDTALEGFFDDMTGKVRETIRKATERDVVAVVGAGMLFGLGDKIRVSALLDRVDVDIRGRLLILFPGSAEDNRYRLLGAGDGWNYLATPIVA